MMIYKKIYKEIKDHETIVISRHIGVDPDALASQLALRDAILLTFPDKKVFAVGNGSTKFHYIGKPDKPSEYPDNALLIVLDTPDKKRIDGVLPDSFETVIKIDHHPFVDQLGKLELIDVKRSSTCEIILDFIENSKLKMDQGIAEKLYMGLVSDTDRFSFSTTTSKTFALVSNLLEKYEIDIVDLYKKLYMRPLQEVRLQGYISQNMTVTDNGLAYIKLTADIISKFRTDAGAAGNMVNSFNYIEEVLVWVTISEDLKNEILKINIRSRGPEVNCVAEKYNGGGHKFAAGARVTTMEEVDCLLEELDLITAKYIKENE